MAGRLNEKWRACGFLHDFCPTTFCPLSLYVYNTLSNYIPIVLIHSQQRSNYTLSLYLGTFTTTPCPTTLCLCTFTTPFLTTYVHFVSLSTLNTLAFGTVHTFNYYVHFYLINLLCTYCLSVCIHSLCMYRLSWCGHLVWMHRLS
jgi:hypothetical protein